MIYSNRWGSDIDYMEAKWRPIQKHTPVNGIIFMGSKMSKGRMFAYPKRDKHEETTSIEVYDMETSKLLGILTIPSLEQNAVLSELSSIDWNDQSYEHLLKIAPEPVKYKMVFDTTPMAYREFQIYEGGNKESVSVRRHRERYGAIMIDKNTRPFTISVDLREGRLIKFSNLPNVKAIVSKVGNRYVVTEYTSGSMMMSAQTPHLDEAVISFAEEIIGNFDYRDEERFMKRLAEEKARLAKTYKCDVEKLIKATIEGSR